MSTTESPILNIVGAGNIGDWVEDDLAARYFTALQDRHVPITPNLALELASMARTGIPSQNSVWGKGFTFAGNAIGLLDRLGNTSLWRDAISGYIQSIVEPVLRYASVRLNSVTLVSTDTSWEVATQNKDYQAYATKLEEEVKKILGDSDEMGESFWTMAGIKLMTHQRYNDSVKLLTALPFIDNLAVSMFYDIEPDFGTSANQITRRIRKTQKSLHRRYGIRPREGGVEGVIHSRRMEELGEAMTNSLIAPKEVRMMKLIEEGFLLTNRPPHRRPVRDFLATVFCEESRLSDSLQLVRSAWLDAIIRLSCILKEMGMSQSELVLCDCKADGISSTAFSVENSFIKANVDPFKISGKIRARVLSESSLCPDAFQSASKIEYKDRVAVQSSLRQEGTIGSEKLKESAISAYRAAYSVRNRSLTEEIDIYPDSKEFGNYAKVLAISIRPRHVNISEEKVPDQVSERRQLVSAMKSNYSENLYTGIIYLPKTVDADSEFNMFGVDNERMETIMPTDTNDPRFCMERLSANLSLWFIKQVLEVIDA